MDKEVVSAHVAEIEHHVEGMKKTDEKTPHDVVQLHSDGIEDHAAKLGELVAAAKKETGIVTWAKEAPKSEEKNVEEVKVPVKDNLANGYAKTAPLPVGKPAAEDSSF